MTLFDRRSFFQSSAAAAVLSGMLSREGSCAPALWAKAKRVVFLHQSGAPSQIDLFDPKPELKKREGDELPEGVRMGQRLTTMTRDQDQKPLVASPFKFKRHGENGVPLSSLLPYTARIADHLCLIQSMTTGAINHDPAVTFMHTGSEQPGRPGLGAWFSYGLQRESATLPDFVVMVSGGQPGDQPLSSRLWSNGFLPQQHAGMRIRGGKDPLLFVNNPPGVSGAVRRVQLEALRQLDRLGAPTGGAAADADQGAAEQTRVLAERWDQYRRALQLQEILPELADVTNEPESTWRLYGDDAKTPGTFAANCVRARRLLERDVPFVQLYHRGWDHHEQILTRLPIKCRETDQASAALVMDLQQRGLLEDTLVIWAGEFGRTAFCQGSLQSNAYGRDHHPRCFSLWLAGGGIKPGVYGKTDEFSYNTVADAVHVHDLQATILHLLGFDHEQLTFRTQGRDYRLTDQFGHVVKAIVS